MVDIRYFSILRGKLSPRIISYVIEWAAQHQDELMTNWERAHQGGKLKKIKALG